ncbi:hypothetical protein ACI2OX_07030 [Bacillus sp. N9]
MIHLIFGMSMDMEKLPRPSTPRKTPRLYAKSNRIFTKRTAENGFIELFIKATTRSVEYIIGFLHISGWTTVAIIALPPIWLKISIACFGYIFLRAWIGSVWNKVIGGHLFTKRYAEMDAYFEAKKGRLRFIGSVYNNDCKFIYI